MAEIDWGQHHQKDVSWRQKIQGAYVSEYTINRYLRLFQEAYSGSAPLSFLELGSGNGDLSRRIVDSAFPFVGRYVVSENFEAGVSWLRESGLEALQLNATSIDLPDESFDVVISFDVMHHVNDPYAMAREMVRVSKGRLLLTEANGLSIFRKIMELTPGHRTAEERSYLPSTYLNFFSAIKGIKMRRARIYPYLFVFKTPSYLAKAVIRLSDIMESLPVLRWQCATVCLDLEIERM